MSEIAFQVHQSPTPEDFLARIRQDAKVLSSTPKILERMENEGFVHNLYDSLQMILSKELQSEKGKIKKHSDANRASSPISWSTNLYVFKENLKAISTIISKLTSRAIVEGKAQIGGIGQGRKGLSKGIAE
jgi:hypothetical protein